MSHQGKVMDKSHCGNLHVIGADSQSALFQVSANHAKMLCGTKIKIDNTELWKEQSK